MHTGLRHEHLQARGLVAACAVVLVGAAKGGLLKRSVRQALQAAQGRGFNRLKGCPFIDWSVYQRLLRVAVQARGRARRRVVRWRRADVQ